VLPRIADQEPNEYGLVFVTDKWRIRANQNGRKLRLNQHEGGEPLSIDSFRQRVLQPILEELGIWTRVKALGVRCGNYAFRHGNATQMDQWGTPLKTRQKRMGHSDAAVTLDHYTEPIAADDLKVADQFGELYRPRTTIIQ
jgi:integrase